MKCTAAVEPAIGYLKAEHRMGRNCLVHQVSDAINTILTAASCNFHLLRSFIARFLLRLIQIWLFGLAQRQQATPANPQGQFLFRPVVTRALRVSRLSIPCPARQRSS